MNRLLYYLVLSVTFIFIINFGFRIQLVVAEQSQINFELIPYLVFSTIFPIIIGILFATPGLINRVKQGYKSRYDWSKFLGLGIPTFVIGLLPIMYFWEITAPFANVVLSSGLLATSFTSIFGVVFGYVLVDCFHNSREVE